MINTDGMLFFPWGWSCGWGPCCIKCVIGPEPGEINTLLGQPFFQDRMARSCLLGPSELRVGIGLYSLLPVSHVWTHLDPITICQRAKVSTLQVGGGEGTL